MTQQTTTVGSALDRYRSERSLVALVVALGVVATVAEGATLVLLVGLAQQLGTPDPLELWGFSIGRRTAVLAAICGAAVFIACRLGAAAAQARAQTRWEHRRRVELASAYAATAPELQDSTRTSRFVEVSTRLVDQAGIGLVNLASGARALVSAAVLVATALLVDPVSAGALAVVSVVLLSILRPVTSRVRARTAQATSDGLATTDEVAELAAAAGEARTFGVSDHFVGRISNASAAYAETRRSSQTLIAASPVLYQGFGLLLAAAAVGAAVTFSDVELEGFGVVAVLLLRTLSYGQHLQTTYQRLVASTPPAAEVDATIAAWRKAEVIDGPTTLTNLGPLELSNVSYQYPDGTPALDRVDLRIDPGSSVAVVGPSGAGKSTLGRVLIRQLRPTDGAVHVNGRPIEDYSASSWAAAAAFVPQHPKLVHGTVHDNIAFFRSDIDRAAVLEAATLAGVRAAIEELPSGFDTEIGPSTRALSGGQLQRVGIARALAGQPQLLVLDEPTSALDADSESVVVDTLRNLPAALTVVVIAHRLSTVEHCEHVLVLSAGAVESWSAHDQARDESDFYRRSLSSQSAELGAAAEHRRAFSAR